MMKSRIVISIAALLASVSALCAFDGDISMETNQNGQTIAVDLVAKGDKVKITPPGGQRMMIMDAGASELTIVSVPDKQYLTRSLEGVPSPETSGKLEKTGETKEILGYPATKVVYTEDSGKKQVHWVTTDLGETALTKMPGSDENLLQQMEEVFGTRQVLPLASVTYGPDGAEMMSMTVTKIEPREVADDEVAPPADFTEMKMPPMPQQMPQRPPQTQP